MEATLGLPKVAVNRYLSGLENEEYGVFGVPEDAFGSRFDPCARLKHGRHQNSNGMGLGLGIALGIVQSHGGELQLANRPNGGLWTTIVLPG